MSHNLLEGKRGIIFGALNDMSIAWKVAERAYEEGASFVLTNAPIAMRMGAINELAQKTKSEVVPADATSIDDLKNLFEKSQEILGGKIDFILHSIGMSPNVRKKKHYTGLNYEWYKQTLDVSAMSLHKTLQVALQNGQELSVEIIKSMPGYDEKDKNRSPVQSGFIQLGVGLGLFFLGIFITQYVFNVISGLGALIFCIGLGQIGYGFYRKAFQIKNA